MVTAQGGLEQVTDIVEMGRQQGRISAFREAINLKDVLLPRTSKVPL